MIQTDIYLDKTDGYLCYEDQYGVKQPVVVNTAFYAKNLELDPSTGHLIVHAADGTSKPIEDAGGIPVSLIGPAGPSGPAGTTPNIGANGNWWIGTTDTGVPASGGSVDVSQLEADVAALQATVSSLSASQGFDYTYTRGAHTAFEVKTIANLPAGTYIVNAVVSYDPSLPSIVQGACLVVNPSTDKGIYSFGQAFTLTKDSEVCIVYASKASAPRLDDSSLIFLVNADSKISITHLNIDCIDDITNHITTSIDTRLTTVEGKVTTLDGDVKAIESGLAASSTDITTIKSDIASVKSNISTLNAKLYGATASFPTTAEPFTTYLWTGTSVSMPSLVPCGYVETGVVYQYLPGGVVPSSYESTELVLKESTTGEEFVATADQNLVKQIYDTIKMNPLAYQGVVVSPKGTITTSPDNYLPLQNLINLDSSLEDFVVNNAGTPLNWTVSINKTGALDPDKMYWIPINEVLATV